MVGPHTKLTRILDNNRVAHRVLLRGEPLFTVDVAAEQRGVPNEEMVKSILLAGHQLVKCSPVLTGAL